MATDPKDASLVSAQLSVLRGRAAVEFYKAAFGAEEVYRGKPLVPWPPPGGRQHHYA